MAWRWAKRSRHVFTSPRTRGGVGALARRVKGPLRESEPVEKAPHPDPLPASGEREKGRHAAGGNPSLVLSPACRLKISQIRRRLAFLGRHQEPIPTQEVVFLADDDLGVVLRRIKLRPVETRGGIADVPLVHSPRPR